MMRIRIPIAASLMILAIAACDKRSPVDENANAVGPAPAAPAGEVPAAVSGGPPSANAAGSAEASGAVPAALHGRWGLTPADCTSTRGDAKGLLVVSGDALKFYESRATPGTSVETGPSSISGNWNFTGEGQSWTKYVSLKLQGDNLIRTERNPVASYSYARCD